MPDPKCIICFLDEKFHYDLRLKSQNVGGCHVKNLRSYRDTMTNIALKLKNVKSCTLHSGNKTLNRYFDDLRSEIDLVAEIQDNINIILSIHENWNAGNIADATNLLKYYIVNQSFDPVDKSNNPFILFRARSDRKRLTADKMLHIPFNERYKVTNQRFSITGQPLLYLGSSILDIFYEMRTTLSTLRKLQISPIICKDFRKIKLFDLSNPFID